MNHIHKILCLTLALSAGLASPAGASRYDPNVQVGPVTQEDAQNLNKSLAEQDILNSRSNLAYDANTDTYYEDIYQKASGGDWKKDDTGWWYRLSDGNYYKNGWVQVDSIRYYFDENGYMKTGWIKANGNWYYADHTGAMVTGARQIDGVTYTFNAYGVLQ